MTREELMKVRGKEVCDHCLVIGNYQDAIANGLKCPRLICEDTQDDFCYDNDIELKD